MPVPDSVWYINEKNEPNDDQNDENFKWWDRVNLTKLILASNKLKTVPKNVQLLSSLVILDVNLMSLFKSF